MRAVLGPTNTGKTYLAIDRMLGHQTGMIGFPLRLLARENYDKVVRLKGEGAAALITGEERIVPANPKYFLCTVEAMPRDRNVEFLAIDEIQLCADAERGHVFTDRLLHARGTAETMFLGAETMAPILRKLVPDATFERRERFSRLSYGGFRKLTRLPPRSAVVAFSASNVYALAELLRRQRGGAAVVLGALSPRTRNAQVAMYEAGEVEYLVATDAIGMGLNMNIAHVGFSSITKFDGHGFRRLTPAELGQIAGRAGRHTEDGTFGPTAELAPFDQDLVDAVQDHKFEAVGSVFWRSGDLDFSSPDALRRSLDARPPRPELRRACAADDYNALLAVCEHEDIHVAASNPEAVRLLWDVCQIPDFSGDLSGNHPRLVGRIFRFLVRDAATIPAEWIERSIGQFDRTDGDIDTLMARISGVRTWSYITHRRNWLDDADSWQARARALEDKLSDALHERLTQRFVDRKTAVLTRRLRENKELLAGLSEDGKVTVESEEVGRLDGFRFVPADDDVAASPRLMAAANRAVREAISTRIAALTGSDDAAFVLDHANAQILWQQSPVARIAAGNDILHPTVEVLSSELLDARLREELRQRLQGWLEAHLGVELAPLMALSQTEFSGAARGLAFRLGEGLGCALRARGDDPGAHLGDDDKTALARAGVRIGVASAYLPAMLKGRVMALKAMLFRIRHDVSEDLPDGGATAMPRTDGVDDNWYLSLGFCPAGPIAIRADELERMLAAIRRGTKDGEFAVNPDILSRIDAPADVFAKMLRSFGYEVREDDDGIKVSRKPRAKRKGPRRPRGKGGQGPRTGDRARQPRDNAPDPDSPFAKLQELKDRMR
ncbi:MAG: disulfide oxidoreductase [Alphaproteobacteria bacterium]|nr:disulfide oxidoreductase [Alphaproteobacteria bacterium]